LESLEDSTLWKLNEYVNAALKQHYGDKGTCIEEEETASTISTESDPEGTIVRIVLCEKSSPVHYSDMEEDRGTHGPGTYCDNSNLQFQNYAIKPTSLLDELKAAKKPRLHVYEKQSSKGQEPFRQAPATRLLHTTSSAKHEDESDGMAKGSDSEYEGEEDKEPEDTPDQSDSEDNSSDESDESDSDWEPKESEPRKPQQSRTVTTTACEEKTRKKSAWRGPPPPPPPPPPVKKEKEDFTPGKPFKIQVCIYSLGKRSIGKKPYICDACDKAFADRSNLIQHLRVHTKEKPYACNFDGCDKRFAHSASLKEHLNTHTGFRSCAIPWCAIPNVRLFISGEKPHICNHPGCGMSFAQASNLRRHQIVHTGEKPFVCTAPGCTKSFTQKINLVPSPS